MTSVLVQLVSCVCVCVCVYVYTYICVYICIHAQTLTRAFVRVVVIPVLGLPKCIFCVLPCNAVCCGVLPVPGTPK